MHGDKDPLVPLAQSQELAQALQRSSVKAELVIIEGAGHGFPGQSANLPKILDFFDRNIKQRR